MTQVKLGYAGQNESGIPIYWPNSTADMATLQSFGFFDNMNDFSRTVEQWQSDRRAAGAEGIIRLLIPTN